jgi:acyl carrier protein
MDSHIIKTLLRNLLAESGLSTKAEISEHTKLGPDGLGLDSMATLDLLLAIEQACDVRMRDEGLTTKDIATFGGLCGYAAKLKHG